MRKTLFFLIGIGFLVGGYFAYQKWLANPSVSAWDFVPSQAALVFETTEPLTVYDSIKQQSFWTSFQNLEMISDWEANVNLLDTLGDETLRTLLQGSDMLLGLFPTSASSMDALLVLEMGKSGKRAYLRDVVNSFKEDGFRYKQREYNGFQIQELYQTGSSSMFSYVIHEGFFVASFTPFLVEDAIRALTDPSNQSFKSNHGNLLNLNALERDLGNLYFNLNQFGSLVDIFSVEAGESGAGSGFMDIDIDQETMKLSGFMYPSKGLLKSFSSESQPMNVLDLVPNNTALLRHFSFNDSKEWRAGLIENDEAIDSFSDLAKSKWDLDMNYFFGLVGNELAVSDLEVVGTEAPDRLIFLSTTDSRGAMAFLDQAASRMTRDSVFVDQVGEIRIGKLDDHSVMNALAGSYTQLNDGCYYLAYQEFVVLSNSIKQLKKLIRSVEEDETWRKSIKVNDLLDKSSREANYSMIVNVPRYWNQWIRSLKPNWSSIFTSNEAGFKSLEYIALQFTKVDDKFYSSMVAYQPEPPQKPRDLSIYQKASLPYPITTKPFVHRSHLNQSLEVLLQDSTNLLYHLSSDMGIMWTRQVSAPIIGAIQAVDYYNNGKKQYAFATENALHIIDRTGTYVEGFPEQLSIGNVRWFSVVDYDGSKNYRFMLTNDKGEITLLDKAGASLEGWNPLVPRKELSRPPEHIRVAGKDAFIHLGQRSIDLVNRRGVSYPGFPMEFEENLVNSYFTEASGTFLNSKLTTLTVAGEIIKINFGGGIERREQLYKPDLETSFDLVVDKLENTFLIIRSSRESWEVLDATGSQLFQKPYIDRSNTSTAFYRFGGDHTVIGVTDLSLGFTTIYDLDGRVLTQSNLASSNPYSVLYFENQGVYEFYLTQGNELNKVRLR